MKLVYVHPDELVVSAELVRSRSSKVFEERLQASIEEMGLAEPLKLAPLPSGKYLIVDGMFRWRAIQAIRAADPSAFSEIPGYVVDHDRRYELRFQTDIYQDLLPSQLANLVEHLHRAEQINKVDIARYIGVSPATLRNYTGLARLIERGGYFARIVELMDVGVIPASNPFAWLRLTDEGLEVVLDVSFSDQDNINDWIDDRIARARRGDVAPYSLKYVEAVTGNLLLEKFYREPEEVRNMKRDLGLRRAVLLKNTPPVHDVRPAIANLTKVSERSTDRVLQVAASSLSSYLQ
jgi:hypothetical protein